jgi:hypothetical protein
MFAVCGMVAMAAAASFAWTFLFSAPGGIAELTILCWRGFSATVFIIAAVGAGLIQRMDNLLQEARHHRPAEELARRR